MASENDQIRMKILQLLYNHEIDDPRSFGLDDKILIQKLSVTRQIIEFNISYLQQKGLIEVEWTLGPDFNARITAFGIDVIESK
jgi:hypothetical protein